MNEVTVILGENGKGKTRYLLDQYEKYKDSKCIATISSSLINPFPMNGKEVKHHNYGLRARRVYSPNLFSRSINDYFDKLLVNHDPKVLFYILNHIGFDDDFIVRREPLYHVNERQNKTMNNIYALEASPSNDSSYPRPLTRITPITPGFAKEYSKFIEKAEEFHLTYSQHMHQSQSYRDHLESEAKLKELLPLRGRRPLFINKFFFRKNGTYFPLEYASSGELYIISLALFIWRFLDVTEKFNLPKLILIDEPENSLHPKWQHEYIGFIKGFIGYENVDIVIATHSPLIAMDDGKYIDGISLRSIEDGQLIPVEHRGSDNNIEQIYYELFGVLTPKNRYLSEYCNDLLKRFSAGKTNYLQAKGAILAMREASFDPDQIEFLNGVYEILKKLKDKLNG